MTDEDRNAEFVANRFELLESVRVPDVWSSVTANDRPPASPPSRGVRRAAVVTSAAAVVGLVFALGWLVGRQDVAVAPTSSDPATPSLATPSIATPSIETTSPTLSTLSTIPTTDDTTTASALTIESTAVPATSAVEGPATATSQPPERELITRPYVDALICETTVARGPDGPSTVDEIFPFATSQESPRSMQVIAVPSVGISGDFVLVQRFFTTKFGRYDGAYGGDVLADPDGKITNGHTSPSGYGDAYVLFPDGTEAYFRARGLDNAELEQIIAATEPRTGDRASSGFDYDPTVGPRGFELVHEGNNVDLRGFGGARSECHTPTDPSWFYRIDAFDGDPILEYISVLDRDVPIEVGERDGIVIMIDGPNEPGRPTVDDVTNAPPDVWAQLQEQLTATENAYYELGILEFPDTSVRIRAAIERAGFKIGAGDPPEPRSESYPITAVDSGKGFQVTASHQFPEILGDYTEIASELNTAPAVQLIRRGDRIAAWAWCSGPTVEISTTEKSSDADIGPIIDTLDRIVRELECDLPDLLQDG